MSSGDTIIQPGSVGTNPDVALRILDSTAMLDGIRMTLQGRARVFDSKLNAGAGGYKEIVLPGRSYSPECIAWAMGKFEEALNKNMYLSNMDKEDFRTEAISMCCDFIDEVWLNWGKFNLDIEKFTELCDKYRNFVSQTIRHPLNQGIRNFLTTTTSEQTQRLTQNITEAQEKKGWLPKLGGS